MLPEFHLIDDERVDLELPDPPGARFRLRPHDTVMPPPGARPDAKAQVEFVRLAAPQDVAILERIAAAVIRTGPLVIVNSGQLQQYPEHFITFIRTSCNELLAAATRCVGLVRWRRDQHGRDEPIGERLIEWSLESGDDAWLTPPPDASSGRYRRSFKHLGDAAMKEVAAMIASGQSEPVHRAVLREAHNLAGRNNRAAFVLGVTAAEIAVKFAIADRVPDAAWLAENVQTPPIVMMLRKYLPTLRAHESVSGLVCPPSKGVIKAIEEAVKTRNALVHKGAAPPTREQVEDALDVVHELVAVLEYSCGFPWAALHVQGDSRFALLELNGRPRTVASDRSN
jgi:hypothetical protein